MLSNIIISAGPICSQQTGLASNRNYTRDLLSYAPSFRICVMARAITDANYYANGFSWNKETKECYGIKEANFIDAKETKWQACIFSGKSA